MRGVSHWLGVILAVAIILLTPAIAYQLIKLFIAADTNVKLGALTAAVSVIALLYNNARQQSREIASRHFSEKREVYQQFFDLLFEFMQSQKDESEVDVPVERAGKILKSIMVWGSAETINAYNDFMRFSASPDVEEDNAADTPIKLGVFEKMETLLRCMRKDLGHSDGRLEKFSLSKLFVKGDEHHKFPR
ncbi:MAG: hypothetical protein ACK4SJ_11570 [Sphingorhabdus sp.]